MKILTFNFPALMGVNCYLVYDEETLCGALIDAGRGFKEISAKAEELGIRIEKVLLTHGHFDHIMDVGKWRSAGAKIYIHSLDAALLESGGAPDGFFGGAPRFKSGADGYLSDGEEISVGSAKLKVVHTPGHTPGSVCYLTNGALFSGDTLFHDSFGRVDFPGGSARDMRESLKKLFSLPDKDLLTVYPGHEETTNLGYESEHNPANYCL